MEDSRKDFFDTIGRPDLRNKLSETAPWTYFSMEIGLPNFSFAGGLGILAGDMFLQAGKLGIPFVAVTLFYPVWWKQHVNDFTLIEEYGKIIPENLNFIKENEIALYANNDSVPLSIYSKEMNRAKIITLFEPGLKELYSGDSRSEHRFYQEAVLGFGGYMAVRKMGFKPSLIHLNESSTVFAAIAYLDDLCGNGMTLDEAISEAHNRVLFTNHTLVPASTACFPKNFFDRYVFKNIRTDSIKSWISEIIKKADGDCLHLSYLAIEITDKLNGVSQMHAKCASNTFKKVNKDPVNFTPVTNGIYMQRWIYRELYRFYVENKVIDQYDLPAPDYKKAIDRLDVEKLIGIKSAAKSDLLWYLQKRRNQYNKSVEILPDTIIAVWAKRFAGYKRANMIFSDQERLANILESKNMRLVISGDVNIAQQDMRGEVKDILALVNSNRKLSERVFFVQDYDQTLAKYLAAGSDIWLNTPEVGKEACGTSWEKAVGNLTLLCSTRDGGVADDESFSYLKIEGENYEKEVESLYSNLEKAYDLISDKKKWSEFVKKQLKAMLPIISGGRMMSQYLNFAFPKNEE